MTVLMNGKIVFLIGAGLSAAPPCNLPTFRSFQGLYENKEILYLATQKGYLQNPKRANQIYDAFLEKILQSPANSAHNSLNELSAKYSDRITIIDQNVDGFTKGIPLYGNIRQIACTSCKIIRNYPYPIADIFDSLHCSECDKKTLHRRNIVLFGEHPLNLNQAMKAVSECNYFIAAGTEISTAPARLLLRVAQIQQALRILINQTSLVSEIHSIFQEFRQGCASKLIPTLCENII